MPQDPRCYELVSVNVPMKEQARQTANTIAAENVTHKRTVVYPLGRLERRTARKAKRIRLYEKNSPIVDPPM